MSRSVIRWWAVIIVALALLACLAPYVAAQSDVTGGSVSAKTCTGTSSTLRSVDPKIRSWVLQGPPTQTATVYVSFSSPAVADASSLTLDSGGKISDVGYTGPLYCITAGTSQTITYSETHR